MIVAEFAVAPEAGFGSPLAVAGAAMALLVAVALHGVSVLLT